MIDAAICTIGDEIIIGQIIDTNSSHIARALEEAGVNVKRMISIKDDADEILGTLASELRENRIVICTGGLGPTKDDITKAVLSKLSGSTSMVMHEGQLDMVHRILASRGLDVLDINRAQALVPDKAQVIVNRLGTAPIMVFRGLFGTSTLYALPGVPHEALGALEDVIEDIKAHFTLPSIIHRSCMVYGMAESALSELIAPWEKSLEEDGIHLAYLPDTLKGVRLRLSHYAGCQDASARIEMRLDQLQDILGDSLYSREDTTLPEVIGKILTEKGCTLSAAESCTGGEIAHLATGVPGSSAWFLGSVTSYAISVKEKVLGVPAGIIEDKGVVSSEVAAAMAEGVRKLTGSDYAVSTTGLAGPSGDGVNPVGTVWIAVTGPEGTMTAKYCYKNDRKRNIERFAASAINLLRLYIIRGNRT